MWAVNVGTGSIDINNLPCPTTRRDVLNGTVLPDPQIHQHLHRVRDASLRVLLRTPVGGQNAPGHVVHDGGRGDGGLHAAISHQIGDVAGQNVWVLVTQHLADVGHD